MAPRCRVVFSHSAAGDLEAILEWYREEGAAPVGLRHVADILEAAERLSAFPASGRAVPELCDETVRELIIPPFRIVYRHHGETVSVVRVWRSERRMCPVEDGQDS